MLSCNGDLMQPGSAIAKENIVALEGRCKHSLKHGIDFRTYKDISQRKDISNISSPMGTNLRQGLKNRHGYVLAECRRLEKGEHCRHLEKDEHVRQLEKGEHCRQLEEVEHGRQLEKVEHCRQLE